MRDVALALGAVIRHVVGWIGLEGALLVVGTIVLAAGAALIHPAGPYLIVGIAAISAGLAAAISPPRGP